MLSYDLCRSLILTLQTRVKHPIVEQEIKMCPILSLQMGNSSLKSLQSVYQTSRCLRRVSRQFLCADTQKAVS